jgi:rubrerythrin
MKTIQKYLNFIQEEYYNPPVDSKLSGTETEKNLIESFNGECHATIIYAAYAEKAREEGFEQIASLFDETVKNEKEHAKLYNSHLLSKKVSTPGEYKSYKVKSTLENLKDSTMDEKEDSEKYTKFSAIARKEGFDEIADLFERISMVESHHEKRYNKLADNVKNNTVFKKSKKVTWKCRNCGYVHEGDDAPSPCPTCKHPQAFYEVMAENY